MLCLNFSFQYQQEQTRMAKIGIDKIYNKAKNPLPDKIPEFKVNIGDDVVSNFVKGAQYSLGDVTENTVLKIWKN